MAQPKRWVEQSPEQLLDGVGETMSSLYYVQCIIDLLGIDVGYQYFDVDQDSFRKRSDNYCPFRVPCIPLPLGIEDARLHTSLNDF